MAMSAMFHSEGLSELSCGGRLDYPLSDVNTNRPSRLGYTCALASISKALGTGANMSLGVGDGVFDDKLDAGLNAELPASAHARCHLGDDWQGPLAARPLGKSQAETGFLAQLLRRKSTGRSQMSERVWKRVSRILRSSRRSRSAHDQEKTTASAPAGPLDRNYTANVPLSPSNGWKRFSRILGNAMVRKSAGDQVPFTAIVDPSEGDGLSDFGSTRRRGLDIPADSMNHVERWSSAEKHATCLDKPIDATRRNIVTSENWYGNFFGADATESLDREPRRHSFGLGLGTRISKRHWRPVVNREREDPGSI